MEKNEKFEVAVFPEGLVITKGEKVHFFSFYSLQDMKGEDILEDLAK